MNEAALSIVRHCGKMETVILVADGPVTGGAIWQGHQFICASVKPWDTNNMTTEKAVSV